MRNFFVFLQLLLVTALFVQPSFTHAQSANGGFVFPEQWGAYGDGTHDDAAAIQSCWTYAAANSVVCLAAPKSGVYLVNEQLIIPNDLHFTGGTSQNGTTIKSEFSGDAIVIAAGPVQGVVMENFSLRLDPTLPSRGFHIQAVSGAPTNTGGMWDSKFTNVAVYSPALECVWLDGGSGSGYNYNLPDQFIDFYHFDCNGPTQPHPNALIRATGQVAQVIFEAGQVNGDGNIGSNNNHPTYPDYPNAIIEINAVYGNQAPGDIRFFEYTSQSAGVCFDAKFASQVSFENGYMENCAIGATASFTTGLSIKSNQFNDTGTTTGVLNFTGGVNAQVSGNTIGNNSSYLLASFASCTNSNTVSFEGNNLPSGATTSGCATVQNGVSSTLTATSDEVLLNGDGGAIPITTINAQTNPGKTLSLIAWTNSFTLASGGNISFGKFASPLSIPAGSSVTLRLYDLGESWVVESSNGATPSTGSSAATTNSATPSAEAAETSLAAYGSGAATNPICITSDGCTGGIPWPAGTPTYTTGTGISSVTCASGYTCTNSRGELTVTGGTATTGTIATVNFSTALSAAPGLCTVTQNGGPVFLLLGHGTPTVTGFSITAGVSLIGNNSVTVDYSCVP